MGKNLSERAAESMRRFERFGVDVVYDRRQDRLARWFGGILWLLSWIFEGLVRTRLYLYHNRFLRNQPLGCLVVVVGNLTVGGTGKTPVVEKFARSLAERGRRVAILSRGYKRERAPLLKRLHRRWIARVENPPKVVSDGKQVFLGAREGGDEPYMLARNLPGVAVLVDKDRVKAGEYAIRHLEVDTLLLDDGLQYLPLKGSMNLVLVDKTNPFGNRRVLPRGILREPIEHIRRASYVFLTKSRGGPSDEIEALIRRHNPEVEIIECSHQPKKLQDLSRQRELPLSALKGSKVASFSGIAVPEGFEAFLRQEGAEIRYNKRFLDHHWFSEADLAEINAEAVKAGAEFLITTEKDAARLETDSMFDLPLYFLRLEIEIIRGVNDFDEAVSRVCFPGGAGASSTPKTPLSA